MKGIWIYCLDILKVLLVIIEILKQCGRWLADMHGVAIQSWVSKNLNNKFDESSFIFIRILIIVSHALTVGKLVKLHQDSFLNFTIRKTFILSSLVLYYFKSCRYQLPICVTLCFFMLFELIKLSYWKNSNCKCTVRIWLFILFHWWSHSLCVFKLKLQHMFLVVRFTIFYKLMNAFDTHYEY